MSQIKCPKCSSSLLLVERRPDGNAKCEACEWHGPYKECFNQPPPPPREFTHYKCKKGGWTIVEGWRPEGKCPECEEVIRLVEVV